MYRRIHSGLYPVESPARLQWPGRDRRPRTACRRLLVEPLEPRLALSVSAAATAEEAPDLVQFAKDLEVAGVTYYGAAWSTHCTQQKALFEDGASFLPYVDVGNPDRSFNERGISEQIISLPTWERPDGTRLEGLHSLEEVAAFTGVTIHASSQPFIAPIDDLTVLSGSPRHVVLDGYDPNGGPLTYTITSSDPALVSTFVPQGNRSMRITVADYGDMVLELFEGRVPRATEHIIELAESGFYDGVIFHRIIDGFMIQGGDPTGTGSGGSHLDEFDDQFHVDLQHNRSGVLSMAKSGDDTNDSQFFIIEDPTRHLDFNHSVFGQLVEGEAVREALSDVPASNTRPDPEVVMTSVDIFHDEENRVVMLSAAEGATGAADITVTVTDSDGNEYAETFHITVVPDVANGGPFLEDMDPVVETVSGTSVEIQLAAIDVEGDPVYFDAANFDEVEYVVDVDHETGLVTVTPPDGFTGTTLEFVVAVRAENGSSTGDTWDSQQLTIEVVPPPPAAIDLLPDSDTGVDAQDDLTRLTTLDFEVQGVLDGAQVTVYSGNESIGTATASGSVVVVTADLATLSDGLHSISATQTTGGVESSRTTVVDITVDTRADGFTSTPLLHVEAGTTYLYDVGHEEETVGGQTVSYDLGSAHVGMQIDPTTGQITWETRVQDAGSHGVVLRATDRAGNVGTQSFTVTVNAPPTIDSVDDWVVDEQATFLRTISVTDPNLPDDSLSFALEGDVPTGLSIDPASGLLAWTPSESQGPETYAVTVRVTDSTGLWDSETVTVQVMEVDRPPVLDPIADQRIEWGELLTFTAIAHDLDVPVGVLRFSLADGAPDGAAIDESTGLFSWTPANDQVPATHTVTVRVTDGTGLRDEQIVVITAVDVDRPPVLSPIETQQAREGEILVLAIGATDPNYPLDRLTFDLAVGAPDGASIEPVTGRLTWTPSELDGGTSRTITVRVTDSTDRSTLGTFSVDVIEANEPPTLAAIEDRVANPGEVLQFTASANDLDWPLQEIQFALGSGAPAGATIDPESGHFTWMPSADLHGVFDITIEATDKADQPRMVSESFSVTINERPELRPIDRQAVPEGESLRLSIEATDAGPTGDTLRFGLEPGAPATAVIDPDSGTLTWTPSEEDGPGTFDIGVRVTDTGGLWATRVLSINVTEVNRPPTLQPIANRDVVAGTTLTLTAAASDPDYPSQEIVFSLDPDVPDGATVDPTTGEFRWTPPKETLGIFDFTIRATDEDKAFLSSSASFKVRVGGSASDNGFGIALAVRSTQVSSTPGRLFGLFGAGSVPQVVPPQSIRPPVVPRSVGRVVRSDLVQSRRELRDAGAAGGGMRRAREGLDRHRADNARQEGVVPVEYPQKLDKGSKKDRKTEPGTAAPAADTSGSEAKHPVEAVDKAIADLMRTLAD